MSEQPPAKVKSTHYIDNEQLLKLLRQYKKTKDKGVSEELGQAFKLIVDRLSYSRQYINYTEEWKNEMKSDALFNCCRYLDNFDEKKGKNAFAYFTMIAIHAFKMRIKKEKLNNTKDKIIKSEIYQEFLDNFHLPKQKHTMNEDMEDFLWEDLEESPEDIKAQVESIEKEIKGDGKDKPEDDPLALRELWE